MSMNKIKNIPLETTASYQALSQLGVQFWNQDTGTAVLQFNITRNNYPLALSEENVEVFIALESGDSFLVDKDLDYIDELNGVVAYTIPDNFMRVAKNVVGQVYVTTLDGEEVVVQRKFSFDVANDLIASLPAGDKIREIKHFSDMRAEVAQMMEKLNNDFEHMNDYVTQVDQKTKDGIAALNTLIKEKQDAYNANHTAKLKELNDKGKEYSNKFDSDKQYIDEKSEAFKQSVNGSGVVTTGQSKDWQKYKITSDDGTSITLTNPVDLGSSTYLDSLKPGSYYAAGPTNSPNGASGFVTVLQRSSIKVVYFQPYNQDRFFVNRFYNTWSGWKEVSFIDPNNPYETVQGATKKANTAESNAKTYTDTKVSSQHAVLFSGTVNGVGNKINLSNSLYDYNQIVISGEYTGGIFNEVVLPPTIKTNIMIQRVNLRDSDGTFFGVYEVKLDVTNGTTLTLSNDVSYDITSSTPSGPNRNAFTVQRIEGWK